MKIKMKIKIKSKYFMAMPETNSVESYAYTYERVKRNFKTFQPAFVYRKLVLQP